MSSWQYSEEERRTLLLAFRYPRGRYGAGRASQLSGVPERTVYHWAQTQVLVPDFANEHPKTWSYRDLVFLRLLVFLRSHDVELRRSADFVAGLREDLSSGELSVDATRLSAADGAVAVGDEILEGLGGQGVFNTMVDVVGHFDLLADLGLGQVQMNGPNLVRPSHHTSMSPWVVGGEPVIRGSRIPTVAIVTLHRDRLLNAEAIVNLYPTITLADVDDALAFESSLT